MFKYINIKTNEVICLKDVIDETGTYFFNRFKDYAVVEHKNINGDVVVLCEEMLEEP